MAILNASEIQRVHEYLESHGLSHEEVRDDVLDHICCELEEQIGEGLSFERAFEKVQQLFPPKEVNTIQSDTLYFLNIKSTLIMIKGIFISAYMSIAIFVMGFGLEYFFVNVVLDEMLAFMLSGLCKFTGIAIFCFAFLPILSLYGYKRFMKQVIA